MTPDEEQAKALANYQALLAKVDDKFTEIRDRSPSAFQCRLGCHSCCRPGLTVGPLEAAAIGAWLAAHPEARAELAVLVATNPHAGTRCSLLRADGGCAIYEARPIVCRSHGAPIQFKVESGAVQRDVCPLNFGGDATVLSGADVINLDTLNTILSLIVSQFGAGTARTPLAKFALLTAD